MLKIFSVVVAIIVSISAYYVYSRYYETEIRTIYVDGKFRRQIVNDKGSTDISFIATKTGTYRLPVYGELGSYDDPRQMWKSLHEGCSIIVETARKAPSITQLNAKRIDHIFDAAHCKTAEDGLRNIANETANQFIDPKLVNNAFAQRK